MTALVFDKQAKIAGRWYAVGERAELADGIATVLVRHGTAHRPDGSKADGRRASVVPHPVPRPPAKHR
jgi:hypothetical protein